jgi:hypothetical protein
MSRIFHIVNQLLRRMCSKEAGVEKETSYLMFIILFIFMASFGCCCLK